MFISPYVWTRTFYMISAVRLYMRRLSYTYMFYSMMVSYEVRWWNGYDMENSIIRIVYV